MSGSVSRPVVSLSRIKEARRIESLALSSPRKIVPLSLLASFFLLLCDATSFSLSLTNEFPSSRLCLTFIQRVLRLRLADSPEKRELPLEAPRSPCNLTADNVDHTKRVTYLHAIEVLTVRINTYVDFQFFSCRAEIKI